ncbi:MAG: hypothetical protein NC930_09605 [Candidatus Omnitrophica bacterium]|nr:hypothetical protein [Candidatus Omnitrophota bacterium]
MKKRTPKNRLAWVTVYRYHSLLFWPLIVMGGRLALRIVLNLWDMLEP